MGVFGNTDMTLYMYHLKDSESVDREETIDYGLELECRFCKVTKLKNGKVYLPQWEMSWHIGHPLQ